MAYPRRALERAIEAEVLLELVVQDDGRVVDATVVEGADAGPHSGAFDAAARGAAYGMVFEPAIDETGERVAARIQYRWTFTLGDIDPLSVDGLVRERGSRRVVAGARIDGIGPDDAAVRTYTDDQGRFRLAALPAGDWLLTVKGAGMVPTTSKLTVPEDDYVDGVTLAVEPRPEWEGEEVDDEIEVIGRIEDAEVARTLDREEVVTLPGSLGDPVRAIQNLPGLSRPPFGSGQLLVRGTEPEDTAYHVDGLRVPLVFHFTAVSTVLSAQLIDEIRFFPGSFGVRYGRAVGGLVDLTVDETLPRVAQTEIGVDIFQSSVFARYRLGEKIGLQMGLRRSYVDALLNPILPSLGLGSFRAPRFYDAQVHLYRKLKGSGRVGVLFLLSDDQFRVIGGESGQELVSYRTTFQKVRVRHHQTAFDGLAQVDTSFMTGPERQSLNLVEPAEGVGDDLGVADSLLSDLPLVGEASEEIVAWSLRHEWYRPVGGKGLGVRVGLDATGGTMRVIDEFDPDTIVDGSRPTFQPAVYAEDQLRIGEFTLSSGLRVENLRMDGRWRTSVDPRLRAALDIDQANLYVAMGGFSQLPTFRELYTPEGPTLSYEHATHRTLGWIQELSARWHLEASVYHNVFDDRVVGRDEMFRFNAASLVVGDDLDPFTGEGVGRNMGLEILAKYRSDTTLLWAAVTLGRSFVKDRVEDTWRVGDFDQPVNVTLIASRDLGRDWRLGARARLVSGPPQTLVDGALYSVDLDAYAPLSQDPYGGRARPFFSADVRFDKEWFLKRYRLTTYLEVQNVTNQRNVEVPGYSDDFRREEPVYGLPILPAFGLKAVF